MKKKLSVVIAMVLTLAMLAACGGGDTPANDTPANDTPANDTPANDAPAAETSNFDTGRTIAVHTREDGSGTRDAFVSLTGVGDDMYEEAVVLGSTNEIRNAVSTNEYAIGYVSVGSLNEEVKALTVDGVAPSNDTILDGSYSIQRPFLLCVTDAALENELVADFIAFVVSPQGQEQVGSSYTPIANPGPDYEGGGMSGELRVGGSTSVEPLLLRMVEAYREINPDVTIDVSAEGSGAGINGAIAGELDIGMSSRELRDTELPELTPITIALDGVAVVVNPANPMTDISLDMIHDIFIGEVTNWSGVIG